MPEYFYQSLLSGDVLNTYQKIYQCLKNRTYECTVTTTCDRDIRKAFTCVVDDHPEIYFIKFVVNGRGSKKGIDLLFEKSYDKDIQFIDRKIKELTEKSKRETGGKSEKDKVLYILDFLIENVVYEIDNSNNQSAASALYYGKAQCSGIARGFKLLADSIGLDCITLSSAAKENGIITPHCWNMVKINGNYYHIDPTEIVGANKERKKPYYYSRAFYSDQSISEDHILQNEWPKCWDKSLENFSNSNNNVDTVSSFYELRELLKRNIAENKSMIKFASKIAANPALFKTSLEASIKAVFCETNRKYKTISYYPSGQFIIIEIEY